MMRRLAAIAAGLLAIAGPAAVPSVASATTGYCTGDGVNAVVDFTALGGEVQKFCDPGGVGKSAGQVFEDVGAHLTRVQRYPGAVCRVENRPANAGCVDMPPADAYWGLFWSRGSGWTYSSEGVDNLTVPNGGTVAFAWQTSSSARQPSVAPAHPARPRPTPRPSPAPTHSAPSPKPTAATHSASRHARGSAATATTPAAGGKHATRHHRARPLAKARHRTGTRVRASAPLARRSAPASPTVTASATPVAAAADHTPAPTNGGGMPAWVPVVVIVALLGAGGAVAVRRRGAA
jgi:hypothetical protein